ncbi:Regulator of chromosome condensation (RCC1)-like protein [Phytophthora cinnamomi]|nr:Regulator of chromosome condensation (RCC1)-like protein [Phytophthora cinnamomi]
MDLGDAPREAIHEKEEELRRAKKLWRTRILRDWEENKDTPLAHSLWRQGIPPSIRARVWPMAIGNKLKVTPEMFKIYRRRAAAYKKDRAAKEKNDDVDGGREHTLALIDTDLPRTFPSLKLFDSSGPYYAFLLEVLETYACYRPDLGYIQGMSYLAAMLCLHMPQDRYLAFQCLANLMVNEHLFTFYLLDADLANVYYTLFDTFLNSRLPHLHAHLREIGVFSCSMYLMNWLQTLFLQVLPLESAARVFDNFLLDGTVFLFRTAMAIHELLAPQLLAAEMDVALPLLQRNVIYQDVWNVRVSEQSLFDTVSTIAVPSHIYSALDRVVNDVFFYEKRGDTDSIGGKRMMAFASGGQSVGIGHVKHERRRMYAISDALNGVLGGF